MDRSKWEYKKLGDCFAYIKNGANIKQISGATGIPITRIETLSNDVFNRDRMGYANIDDVTTYSSNILNDGDILMSHINSMKFLGRAVEYKKIDEEVIIHGMNLLRMIPTSNFLSSYAVYQFKTDHFRKQVKAISHQAVNQASFNVTNLKGLNLIVPPIADQQRIVAELDCLNEMIALKQEQLKEFDKLAQSIFYDMFGNPSKEIKRWDVFTLEELIQNNVIIYHLDGNHGGDYPRSDEFVDSGITYIGANCIKDGVIDFSLAKYLTEEKANSLRKGIAKDGDVLFAHNATVGPVALLRTNKEKIILSTTLTAFRCNNTKLIPEFLKAYMESAWFVCQYASVMKQATRNQVPITKQRKMSFILPPLALQQQFAEKIQAIEAQKELVKKSIAETQQLLDSRMDFYFD